MGPHLDPGQRVFIAWMNHQVRRHLHLADAHAAAVAVGPLTAEQRRDVDAILAVTRQLVETLDELLAADAGPPR
jgi:hypothetical protein